MPVLVIVTGMVSDTPAGSFVAVASGSVAAASVPAVANDTAPVNGSATSVPGIGPSKSTTSVQVPVSGLRTVASRFGQADARVGRRDVVVLRRSR